MKQRMPTIQPTNQDEKLRSGIFGAKNLFGNVAERAPQSKRLPKKPNVQLSERRPPRKVVFLLSFISLILQTPKAVHIPQSINPKGLASLLGVRAVLFFDFYVLISR